MTLQLLNTTCVVSTSPDFRIHIYLSDVQAKVLIGACLIQHVAHCISWQKASSVNMTCVMLHKSDCILVGINTNLFLTLRLGSQNQY